MFQRGRARPLSPAEAEAESMHPRACVRDTDTPPRLTLTQFFHAHCPARTSPYTARTHTDLQLFECGCRRVRIGEVWLIQKALVCRELGECGCVRRATGCWYLLPFDVVCVAVLYRL